MRPNLSFGDFLKKILYPVTGKCFLDFNAVFMLDGLILFCKGDFRGIRCL